MMMTLLQSPSPYPFLPSSSSIRWPKNWAHWICMVWMLLLLLCSVYMAGRRGFNLGFKILVAKERLFLGLTFGISIADFCLFLLVVFIRFFSLTATFPRITVISSSSSKFIFSVGALDSSHSIFYLIFVEASRPW